MSPTLRQVVLDTETTGLDANSERIIEVACLELENFVATGRNFQTYVNPQQPVSAEALAVHGLSDDFLKNHPPFQRIASDIISFIDGAPLIIHNASFDLAFLHAEFKRIGETFPPFQVIDTLTMARKKLPGSPASLDALCRRFNISLAERNKHGALIDCQLLASVYIELLGGQQRCLAFTQTSKEQAEHTLIEDFPERTFEPSKEEAERHQQLISEMRGALWEKYYKEID